MMISIKITTNIVTMMMILLGVSDVVVYGFQQQQQNLQHHHHQYQHQQQDYHHQHQKTSLMMNKDNDGGPMAGLNSFFDRITSSSQAQQQQQSSSSRGTRPILEEDQEQQQDEQEQTFFSTTRSINDDLGFTNNKEQQQRSRTFPIEKQRSTLPVDDKEESDNNVFTNMLASFQDSIMASTTSGKDDNKFDFQQRIESLKSVVVGALSGGIAVTPIAFIHYVIMQQPSNFAQWEFVTDMGSLQSALFAIVYRYCIRTDDNNPMLNQGVVGSFILTRTLSNIQTTSNCLSVPLRCGEPLGYFNWDMISQGLIYGIESAVLFGSTAIAMEYAFNKNWITKFD